VLGSAERLASSTSGLSAMALATDSIRSSAATKPRSRASTKAAVPANTVIAMMTRAFARNRRRAMLQPCPIASFFHLRDRDQYDRNSDAGASVVQSETHHGWSGRTSASPQPSY